MAIDIERIREKILDIIEDERFQEIWDEAGLNMRSGRNVDTEDRAFANIKLIDLLAYEHYFRLGWKQKSKKPSKLEKDSTELFLKRLEMRKGYMFSRWTCND